MSAYGEIEKRKKIILPYLPAHYETKTGLKVKVVEYESRYEQELFQILKAVIDEGQSYPFLRMDTLEAFRNYYTTHDCYVCVNTENNVVVGGFYVKPNYPGRCNHICNAGFIVHTGYRNQGIASILVPLYLKIARDLGYEASIFNLVFETNAASLKLWDRFGFQRIGKIPRAGRLEGLGYTDAVIYYYDLLTLPKSEGLVEKS